MSENPKQKSKVLRFARFNIHTLDLEYLFIWLSLDIKLDWNRGIGNDIH